MTPEQKADMLESVEAWLNGKSGEAKGLRLLYRSRPKSGEKELSWLAAFDEKDQKLQVKRFYAFGGRLHEAVFFGERRSPVEEWFAINFTALINELLQTKKIAPCKVPYNYSGGAKLFALPTNKQ